VTGHPSLHGLPTGSAHFSAPSVGLIVIARRQGGCRISRSVLGSQICHYSVHQGQHISGACRQLISLRASFNTPTVSTRKEPYSQTYLNHQLPRAERDKPPPRRKRPYLTGRGLSYNTSINLLYANYVCAPLSCWSVDKKKYVYLNLRLAV
jgi:hypothetical protein